MATQLTVQIHTFILKICIILYCVLCVVCCVLCVVCCVLCVVCCVTDELVTPPMSGLTDEGNRGLAESIWETYVCVCVRACVRVRV